MKTVTSLNGSSSRSRDDRYVTDATLGSEPADGIQDGIVGGRCVKELALRLPGGSCLQSRQRIDDEADGACPSSTMMPSPMEIGALLDHWVGQIFASTTAGAP